MAVRFQKKVSTVPEPVKAKFLYGTWPPAPGRINKPLQNIKPQAPSTRDYLKKLDLPR